MKKDSSPRQKIRTQRERKRPIRQMKKGQSTRRKTRVQTDEKRPIRQTENTGPERKKKTYQTDEERPIRQMKKDLSDRWKKTYQTDGKPGPEEDILSLWKTTQGPSPPNSFAEFEKWVKKGSDRVKWAGFLSLFHSSSFFFILLHYCSLLFILFQSCSFFFGLLLFLSVCLWSLSVFFWR